MTGLIVLPWWGYIIVTLALTHITIAAVTLYLHRCQAHRAVNLHPVVSHFFRFWLWLTTGMRTQEWVAVHRKHHAQVESADDPHSPQTHGINKVLWEGVELYREECENDATIVDYGHATPDDWMEKHFYLPFTNCGIVAMLAINVLLFGVIGVSIWAIQMAWIPFFAAGVINGLGHWWGYRNYDSPDAATNITPIGILIGGEEMHNNHHAFASSARFSSKWWEFDIGWFYICCLQALGMARVKKLAPRLLFDPTKDRIDADTATAVVTSRMHVMSDYTRNVIRQVYRDEYSRTKRSGRIALRKMRRLLNKPQWQLDTHTIEQLEKLLNENEAMKAVYEFRQKLQQLWQDTALTEEMILKDLQQWCRHAEQSGIAALEDFVALLRGYSLQPALPAP